MRYESTKILELGSCAFRQWRASHSHCKFIHGYRLVAKFWFACNELDDKNWVVDFGGLKGLKQILEKQFDHTLCVAKDDPLLEGFKTLHTAGGCDLRIMDGVGIERTAEWCLKAADQHVRSITNNRCWVTKVEVWEHEKNSALAIASSNNEQYAQEPSFQAPGSQVHEFLKDVEQESGVNLTTVLKNIPSGPSTNPKAAPLNNKITSGFSNLFGGTSWGS